MKRLLCLLAVLLLVPSLSLAEVVTNQTIAIHFPYGDRTGAYTGEMENGIPSGYGIFETQNTQGIRWTHAGFFENGTMNGKGYTVWLDANMEKEGLYADGLLVEGRIVDSDGDFVYDGMFSDSNAITGKGKVYSKNVLIFDGTFENGVLMEGKLYNKDGSIAAEGSFGQGFVDFIQKNYVNGYIYH